jgi:RNA polymerase sigma factor (sigma-70 family)
MKEDTELLRAYAQDRSEEAFAELVRRRVGLVYSVALRKTGDAHRARDVAQRVFTDLARKAAALSARPVLAGWLYRSAHYAASDMLRAERSRAAREQEAHLMQQLTATDEPVPDWDKVRPLLDDALNEMDERDRDAILLRFMDGRPFAEVGARLALSENAARMRVERALEKLRLRLGRRGVTSTTAALAAALAQPAMASAPAGLAGAIAGAALSGAAAGAGATIVTAFLMKTSTAIAGTVALLAAVGAAAYQTHQAQRTETELAALAQERDGLAARLRAAENLGLREKQRAAAAEQQTAELRTATSAPAPTPAAAAAPAPQPPRVAISVVPPVRPPEVQRAMMRNLAATNYAALFRQLGLTEAQQEQFKEAFVERDAASSQMLRAAMPPGAPIDQAAMQNIRETTDAAFQARLRETLGGAAVDAFRNFESTLPLRSRADDLARALFYTEAPLTPTQADQLVDLMANHARNPQGKVEAGTLNTEAVLSHAQSFLTPPQIAKFRDLETQRANNFREAEARMNAARTQIGLPAAKGG